MANTDPATTVIDTRGERGTKMRGGEAIVATLDALGVEVVFGLPGVQIYELFDGLALAQDRITTITPRHEQATAYMAFGYAKASGKLGTFAVVPGPGMLNASAAALTAHAATTPLLALTGQVPTPFIGKERGHLHEMPDQLGTFRSFLKDAHRIETVESAPAVIRSAAAQAVSDRPGVVMVEMAWDTMSETATVTPPSQQPSAELREHSSIDAEAIDEAAALILQARRPMIMVGGGALDAGEPILTLAELLDAPVVSHRGGRGIVSEAHRLGMPGYPGYLLWPEVDLLIGIGTRLEMPYLRWQSFIEDRGRGPVPALLRIDIDPDEFGRVTPDVGIVGDASRVVAALVDRLRSGEIRRSEWNDHIAQAKAQARGEMEERLQPQLAFLDVIREALPPDGILVEELSQLGFASWVGYPVLKPRTYISAGAQGTLGFGFATALGAKVAKPDVPVVSITGDGGLMFGIQELATAAEYGINTVTIVVNNSGYANVRRDQQMRFEGRAYRADFLNPDFELLASAFGVGYARADTPEALRPVIAAALAAKKPFLIEVRLEPGTEAPPWPFLHPQGFAGR